MPTRSLLTAVLLASLTLSSTARCQTSRVYSDSARWGAAPYMDRALGIAPVWNGLAVVRGASETRVANLSFFWPRAISPAFAGDSARRFAERAVATRRTAALLTDAGAALLALAAIRSIDAGRLDGVNRGLAVAGAAAFVVSIPLQFSADGWLSRAVWWHNAELVR